jgi:hypothetical protein
MGLTFLSSFAPATGRAPGFQGTAHNIKQQQQVMGLAFLSSFAPATGRAPGFQGTVRNIKQEQQVMGLAFLSALPRPPAGPPASKELPITLSKNSRLWDWRSFPLCPGHRPGPLLVRHSQRKRGATDRSDLRSMASALDSTCERPVVESRRPTQPTRSAKNQ